MEKSTTWYHIHADKMLEFDRLCHACVFLVKMHRRFYELVQQSSSRSIALFRETVTSVLSPILGFLCKNVN